MLVSSFCHCSCAFLCGKIAKSTSSLVSLFLNLWYNFFFNGVSVYYYTHLRNLAPHTIAGSDSVVASQNIRNSRQINKTQRTKRNTEQNTQNAREEEVEEGTYSSQQAIGSERNTVLARWLPTPVCTASKNRDRNQKLIQSTCFVLHEE